MTLSRSFALWCSLCSLPFARFAVAHETPYEPWQWLAFWLLFVCVFIGPSWTLYQIWKRLLGPHRPTPVARTRGPRLNGGITL
jgi:hypothetical protein